MAVDNLHEKLSKVVSKKPSKWLEDAKFRRANKGWLKRSQKVALQILTRLDELNMSQKKLAEILSISPQQVNKWCTGKENFTFETIDKLEQALDCQIMDICSRRFQEPILQAQINIVIQPENVIKKPSSYPMIKEHTHAIAQANSLASFNRSSKVTLC